MFLSDHHPITITLTFPDYNTRTKTWRLNPSLLKDPDVIRQINTRLQQYFQENSSPETTPVTLWEAHKCVIRGKLIALATKEKKIRQAHIASLIETINRLEKTHKQSTSQSTLQDLLYARTNLLEELGKRTRRQYVLRQKVFYEHGNKSGRLLARTIQAAKTSSIIHHLRTDGGAVISKNEDIAAHFESFYSKLYNLPSHNSDSPNTSPRQSQIHDFLTQYCPKPITPQQAANLEGHMTIEELGLAIKQMKVGKSPGPDGLPLIYYKSFLETLSPQMLKAFNSLAVPSTSPGNMLEAHIAVIPKADKDPSLAANYRPISLLNVDIKLYAKILANRLLPLIPGLISADQVGFVPGREARENTTRTLNIHHWLTSSGTEGFLLSLDAEKAFDRVAWDYMRAVLKGIGLPPHMYNYITGHYIYH